MKKFSLLIFIAAIILLSSSCARRSTEGLIFTAVSELEAYEVSGYIGANKDIVIPNKYDGYTVIGIGKDVFKDLPITSVYIPKNLEYIGPKAFQNAQDLKSVKFERGSKLEKIDNNAFEGCSLIEKFIFPSSLTFIGYRAFFGNSSINEVNLPETVQEIHGEAFTGISKVKSLFIPKNVKVIGNYAFSQMSSLEKIEVHESNQYFSSVEGVLFSKDMKTLIAYPNNKINEEYSLPDDVIMIKKYAISNPNLKILRIKNEMEKIETSAVESCPNLESIFIYAHIKKIETLGFFRLPSATIYTRLITQPPDWSYRWNDDIPVVWGY